VHSDSLLREVVRQFGGQSSLSQAGGAAEDDVLATVEVLSDRRHQRLAPDERPLSLLRHAPQSSAA